MTMREHNTNPLTDIAKPESEASDALMADDFDAARVFADPVAYLASFGLRSELAETHHSSFPAAA